MKKNGWRCRDSDKTDEEYFSWCQKGYVAETNYPLPAKYDSKYCEHRYFICSGKRPVSVVNTTRNL